MKYLEDFEEEKPNACKVYILNAGLLIKDFI